MVPSNFQQVFGTLAVGVIIFVVIIYVVYVLRFIGGLTPIYPKMDLSFFAYVKERLADNITAFTGFVLVVLMYASGIIFEHYLFYLDDNDRGRELAKIIPSENQLRLDTMADDVFFCDSPYLPIKVPFTFVDSGFWETPKTDCEMKIQLIPLGKDILGYEKLDSLIKPPGIVQKIRKQLSDSSYQISYQSSSLAEKDLQQLESWFSEVYYQAKNWTFKHPNYFKELDTHQYRVDFTWSMVYIMRYCGLIIFGTVSTFHLLALIYLRFWGYKKIHRKWHSNQVVWPQFASTLVVLLLVFQLNGLLFSKTNVFVEAYRNAEIVYNEKAYGYFISHHTYHDVFDNQP